MADRLLTNKKHCTGQQAPVTSFAEVATEPPGEQSPKRKLVVRPPNNLPDIIFDFFLNGPPQFPQ